MDNQSKSFFFKIDQITNGIATKIGESTIVEAYDDITAGLDQKQKNKITLFASYLLSVSPFLLLLIISLINSSIKNKNSLFLNLEQKIEQVEKLQKDVQRFSTGFSKHSNFSSKNKAQSYFKNTLREFNLPSNSITINKLEESFIGDLKKVYIELNFSQLGQQELSKLIKTIKNKMKATISNISIRSDKSSKLAIGLIHMEFITK